MDILKNINLINVPKHVAIIMDGNGRWAQKQDKNRIFGHNVGVESVREALKAAQQIKVKYLTLYAFSTENWNRPKEEVDALMQLLVDTISNEVESLHKNNVVVRTIGDLKSLPGNCEQAMKDAYEKTKKNTGIHLVLALNYSGRWDIQNAIKKIGQKIKNKGIDIEDIDTTIVSDYLSTKGIPDPELMIRTSGEYRISNFLLWELAYTELYFTDILWPDFKQEHFFKAILDYQKRERRFGKTSKQLQENNK